MLIDWLLVLLSLALVLACGIFVAAEFALVTVDRASVERAAERGDRGAAGVLAALRQLSTQLSGAQLGITITNLLIGFLAEPAVASLLHAPFEAVGFSTGTAEGVSVVVSLVLATAVTMVAGELIPKNLAIARPIQTARAVQGLMRGFTAAFRPVITLLNGSANRLVRAVGVEPAEELASARSAEELVSLVRRSAAQGTLGQDTAMLFVRSVSFPDKRARDVLTPRVRLATLTAGDPVSAVVATSRRTGRSRFPVLGPDGLDDVVGVVHAKHVPLVPFERRDTTPVRDVMEPALFVPETLELDDLLLEFRQRGLQLAVVVDEYGGTAGVVTLEDLVEELVGPVQDEHDPAERPARQLPGGGWVLSGLLRPDEVAELTGIELPRDPRRYETLGGLVTAYLDRIPEPGEQVELAGARITVVAMDGFRVDQVGIEVPL
ncbi:MAG TPA: hemolysin family protein [Mycobacteriales bacterium]|nr:hemolysin family protein [Mycobacteriales bacterium]